MENKSASFINKSGNEGGGGPSDDKQQIPAGSMQYGDLVYLHVESIDGYI